MQNSLEKGQENQDEGANSMEDSPMTTIEYLRARLLSERLVSKAAKERADELVKRVEELEEQLRIVTFQRKKAEKATLEVLSFLASRGISDISEVYESESDKEESLSESNEGKCDATQEAEVFGSSKLKENNEASGSDYDSTTSSNRALSWKGCKKTMQLSDKKYFDSMGGRASFAQVSFSQRRLGRSCRQIKRRETSSAVEESGHVSANSDAQDYKTVDFSEKLANCLDKKGEECNSSSPGHKHECCGEMERALEHQAQLIGRYEAHEKAQRDWEEKHGEANISTLDSCEPGNHSDVSEERDENKEAVPHRSETIASQGDEPKSGTEANLQGKESSIHHFSSFKLPPHADTESSQNHNFTETQASSLRSRASDFSFSMDTYESQEHIVPTSFHSSAQSSPLIKQSAGPIASYAGSSFNESEPPENLNRHREIVPREPERLGSVLGALQEAKLLIKRQMSVLPETRSASAGKAIEASVTGMTDADCHKVPVGFPGLFHLPTILQSQTPAQNRLLSSEYLSEMTNSSLYSGAPPLEGDQYIQRPMGSRINVPTFSPFSYSPRIDSRPGISSRQPRLDFNYNTGQPSSSEPGAPSHPSFPDLYPGMAPKQMLFSPVQRTVAGMPPSGSHLYYDHDVRPNLYR